MNNEIAALRGRLAATKEAIENIATGIDVDIEEARCMLDKYTPKSELNPERLEVVINRLCREINQYKVLDKQRIAMEQDLGAV